MNPLKPKEYLAVTINAQNVKLPCVELNKLISL
jgi:hypothetical protein